MGFKETLYLNLQTMPTETYQKYLEEKKNGYIAIKSHPEDENLIILNYTEQVTFERRWNEQTMSARGLILDITNASNNDIKILSSPFEKFFNFSENLEYEKDIDFTEIPLVMEKMDGSLGISYLINGELRFATRGSFTSEQAIKATEIWHEKYREANQKYWKLFGNTLPTLLVEIIYPKNRIVVNYGEEEKLVLLGIKDSLGEHSYHGVKMIGEYMRLPIVNQFDLTLEKLLELKSTIPANEEGWVLRFSNNKRLKIKGDEYIEVHRISYGLSDKTKIRAWSEDKLTDLIVLLPEEFRNELEQLQNDLDQLTASIYIMLTLFYQQVIELHKERKDFAIHISQIISPEYRHFMFDAYKNGEISKQLIKEYIYKNYNEYLEVIRTWSK